MRTMRALLLMSLYGVGGCFPIELDVNAKGEILIPRQEGFFLFQPGANKLTRLHDGGPDRPVFARFAPNGAEAVLVVKEKDGFDRFRFEVIDLESKKTRPIFKTERAGNVVYSPDGKHLAVIRYEHDPNDIGKTHPEVHIVDVKIGASKRLIAKVGPMTRWFADSKRLVVFKINQTENNSEFHGELLEVETAGGGTTALARAVTRKEGSFDFSPDNRTILLTAVRAASAGEEMIDAKNFDLKLFVLDVPSKKVRATGIEAKYVRYSPDGKKVLFTKRGQAFDFFKMDVRVADAKLAESKTLATDAHEQFISLNNEGVALPSWYDNDRILYFVQRSVYGFEGKALHLSLAGPDVASRKHLQPEIDAAVLRVTSMP